MRKIVFVFIALMFVTAAYAQDNGRVVTVKVYENYGLSPVKSYINIITASGAEAIDLQKTRRSDSDEQIANDKKIRESLDRVVSGGYTLKTSHQTTYGPDNSYMTTTYVFEKK
jgi:hypothetical protein